MTLVHRLARHPIIRQQGRFLVVAVVAATLDFGAANMLAFVADVDKVISSTIALSIASVANFVLNRYWTFERRGRVDLRREVLPFAAVVVVVVGLTSGVVWLAQEWFGESALVFNAARFTGLAVIWFVKFFVFRHLIFVDRPAAERR